MSTSNISPRFRTHIESFLSRALTDEDLRPAASFDDLGDDQIALLASIQPRNYIASMAYLEVVVPTASHDERTVFVDGVQAVHVARQPAQELRDRAIFEQYAGRPLTNAECARIATVYDMSEAHIDLTTILARKDVTIAFLYLSRIAPEETIEQRHHVAKELAGQA